MDDMSLEVTDKHSTRHEEASDSSPLSESFVGPTHESEEEKIKKLEAAQMAKEAAEGLEALGDPPPTGSEIRDFKCSIHKKTPAKDFCPNCEHPYCSKCLQEFPGRGILCYYCREPLVKGVHTDRKVAKRKKRIKWSAVFTTTAAVVTVSVIAFWQIYQPFAPGDLPPEVTIEQLDPAPLRLPSLVALIQLEPPPGFLPPWAPAEIVSPPPKDLPPLIAMNRLDPPPGALPPEAPLELVSPEIAAILRQESELHKKIFVELENEVTRLKDEYTKGTSTDRTRTLKRLFDLDHKLSLEPLTTALQDPDEKVRGLAATELGRFGSSRVVKPLADALPDEKSSEVRTKIVSALKTCGDESAFPALIEALSDKEFQVRAAAYTALRRLSSQNIRFSALRDPAEQKDAIDQWKAWFANSKNKVIHGNWYRMRTPIGQAIAVNRFHGPQVRSAVNNGLKWLLSVQEEEGYWEQAKFALVNKETGEKYIRPGHNLGLTGLALLVFLANGHTPEVGQYKKDVSKIVDWMLKNQRENGYFKYKNSVLYGHGICTMAICEAYGMTGEERYKRPAMKAIEYIVNTQGRHGGFGYSGPGYDVSVSGWQFMGMAAAMEAGLHVPERAIRKSRYFLNYMYFKDDGSTGYSVDSKTKERRKGSTAMTAVGIVCRQFLEYPKSYNEIQKSMEKLRSVFAPNNAKKWKCHPTNPYEMYYATLAMFQAGGEDWAKWNRAFRDELLNLQEKEGPFKGAWPEKVHHGTSGGRLYSTTVSALCLSVYYRYPPIYK